MIDTKALHSKARVLGIALLASGTFAYAGYFKNGNALLENIHSDPKQTARFYAYVSAVVDALDGRGLPDIGCFRIPSNATIGQVADSAKIYLEKNPGNRHQNAAHLVIVALSKDFPC